MTGAVDDGRDHPALGLPPVVPGGPAVSLVVTSLEWDTVVCRAGFAGVDEEEADLEVDSASAPVAAPPDPEAAGAFFSRNFLVIVTELNFFGCGTLGAAVDGGAGGSVGAVLDVVPVVFGTVACNSEVG